MIINVKVKPGSGEQAVERVGKDYIVKVKSRAEDNKANLELLKLLKRHFKKQVKIKSGLSSRNKRVEVG